MNYVEAMKQALAWLDKESFEGFDAWAREGKLIRQILRTAIEAAEKQEPVAQLQEDAFGRGQVMWFKKPADQSMLYTTPPAAQRQPPEWWPAVENILNEYGLQAIDFVADFKAAQINSTTPAAQRQPEDEEVDCPRCGHCCPQRQPLTEAEIADIWDEQLFHITDMSLAIDFVRDIEAAHGITGEKK